ncbi:MAG: hypothetical protein JKX73_10640, partial [Flavobacteriales bacterium]|nr:hypothetical protein [Flavobacteriales bacterium]
MSNYDFNSVSALELSDGFSDLLSDGVHIILFNPTTPPPHLLILVHGSVFSLSVSGPRVNWALSELLNMVARKKIPT